MSRKSDALEAEQVQEIKLTDCPFCGKNIAIFTNCQELEACETFEYCPNKSHYVSVVCSLGRGGCGASSGFFPTKKEAADAWNRRSGYVSVKETREILARCNVGPSEVHDD